MALDREPTYVACKRTEVNAEEQQGLNLLLCCASYGDVETHDEMERRRMNQG